MVYVEPATEVKADREEAGGVFSISRSGGEAPQWAAISSIVAGVSISLISSLIRVHPFIYLEF